MGRAGAALRPIIPPRSRAASESHIQRRRPIQEAARDGRLLAEGQERIARSWLSRSLLLRRRSPERSRSVVTTPRPTTSPPLGRAASSVCAVAPARHGGSVVGTRSTSDGQVDDAVVRAMHGRNPARGALPLAGISRAALRFDLAFGAGPGIAGRLRRSHASSTAGHSRHLLPSSAWHHPGRGPSPTSARWPRRTTRCSGDCRQTPS